MVGKINSTVIALLGVLLINCGAAHAKSAHNPTTQATPVANDAAKSPAGSTAAAATASVETAAPTAYAPAPTADLTGLLDSIFKPQEVAPQPAVAAAPAAAANADETSANITRVARGSGPMRDLVAKHAAANGVPFALAHAVIMIESKYAARVAHAGNYGLMQIRAQTARGMGFSGSAAGLLDADTNLRFGMKYLALAYKMARGDVCGALMRYQSGVATTRMSAANRAYCARAKSYMAHM